MNYGNEQLNVPVFFKQYLKGVTRERERVQYEFKFENNYGASVIKGIMSYGHEDDLWELAVLEYDKHGVYIITYDTPISNDVVGYLTEKDVLELLVKIREL